MFGISLFKEVSFFFKDITHNSNFSHLYTEMPEKERGKKEKKEEQKKERKKERKNFKKCTSMASTNCYKFNIHPYRFCVSYIGVSVSRVGPTRTAYSIFFFFFRFAIKFLRYLN